MLRLAVLRSTAPRVVLVVAVAACGVETDDRPKTLEYVTAAIFAPSCGTAACHSAFGGAQRLTLDTVEGARVSLVGYIQPMDPDSSLLYQTLISPGGEGNTLRMPYDQPLPQADIELVRVWIERGAPGL